VKEDRQIDRTERRQADGPGGGCGHWDRRSHHCTGRRRHGGHSARRCRGGLGRPLYRVALQEQHSAKATQGKKEERRNERVQAEEKPTGPPARLPHLTQVVCRPAANRRLRSLPLLFQLSALSLQPSALIRSKLIAER
jgi:hypothetical protein